MTNATAINQSVQPIQKTPTSYESYEAILSNLGTSKQTWLQFLQWNSINYIWQETLDYLLRTEDDLHEWNQWWSRNVDDLIANISDYRQYRIIKSHSNLTLAEFQWLYREDAREALERLFVEPIYNCIIDKLESSGMKSEYIYALRMNGKVERLSGIFAFT